MQLESCSFIDENLQTAMADILYGIKFNNKPGYLYLLAEHQSTPDALMPFRLMHYMLQIMRQHLDKGYSTLPVIYPLVFIMALTDGLIRQISFIYLLNKNLWRVLFY